uniref:Uncharacterized protein n=1 Tax=viral metagenome TaxID=1070528 RepID=A0A6H1ZHA7_9ZZZZ
MIKTLDAKNKTTTKDGRPKWGILVDGAWWNTISLPLGAVIDTLNKGDTIDVQLVDTGTWKNVEGIMKVEDVNDDVTAPVNPFEKKAAKDVPQSNKDVSIVRQSLSKVASVEIGGLCPAIQMVLYGEVINDDSLGAGDKAGKLIELMSYMTRKFVNDNIDFGLGK